MALVDIRIRSVELDSGTPLAQWMIWLVHPVVGETNGLGWHHVDETGQWVGEQMARGVFLNGRFLWVEFWTGAAA